MTEPCNITVYASRHEDIEEIIGLLPSDRYRVRRQLTVPGGVIESGPTDVDLRIVTLPPEFEVVGEPEGYTFGPSPQPVLYILSDPSPRARQWAFRRGAADLLLRPFSDVELRYHIERAMTGDRWRFERATTEKQTLEFLKSLLARNVKVLRPSPDPTFSGGYFYPEVARFFGRSPFDSDFLGRLASEGVLASSLFDRVRLCPQCLHPALNFREICPNCDSINIVETEAIHHFACGHVAGIDVFRQGAELVCPKCHETLRHIGLDYEKPSQHFTCRACEFVFAEPKVDAACLRCGTLSEPSRTVARNISQFELTPLAHQAVEEQQLGGTNLAKLLRNRQTGLYTRQFLELQAEREFLRAKRHGEVFCVLMIRIGDFDEIVSQHPKQATDYVNTLFMELSSKLRALDMTCVWGRDLLAVLLPNTPEDGAKTVARRMESGVRGLEYLYSIHEPSIAIRIVPWKPSYEDYWEIFGEALRMLNE